VCASSAPAERKAGGAARLPSKALHPHDVGTLLNEEGVAIRTGPPLRATGHAALQGARDVPRVVRFYNSFAEVDALVAADPQVQKVFG
jgi:cysteine desulfurase/selenocysteine lyase